MADGHEPEVPTPTTEMIDQLNLTHYTQEADTFDHVPFKDLLPNLLRQHLATQPTGFRALDVGSGPGALALWVQQHFPGSTVECLDPCPKMVEMCRAKGLVAHEGYIQTAARPPLLLHNDRYHCILAISSLIHVPRRILWEGVWERLAGMLEADGLLVVAMILGDSDGVADPTSSGNPRFFTRVQKFDVIGVLSRYGLQCVDMRTVNVEVMREDFWIGVCRKESDDGVMEHQGGNKQAEVLCE